MWPYLKSLAFIMRQLNGKPYLRRRFQPKWKMIFKSRNINLKKGSIVIIIERLRTKWMHQMFYVFRTLIP